MRQYSKNCPRYSAIFLINDEIKNKKRKAKDNSLEREDTNDDDPIGDDIGDLKEEREYSINQFYELIRSPQTELACFAVKILFHGACKRRRKSCNVYVLFTEHTTGPFISPNFKRASISIRFTIERSRPSTYVPSTEEERPLLKTEREKRRKDQPDWSTPSRYIFYRHSKNIPFLVPPLISDRSFLLDQTFSKINLLLPFTSNTFIFSIDFFKIIQILITKEKMLSQKQIFFYYIISSNSWKIRSKLILLAWNTNGYK